MSDFWIVAIGTLGVAVLLGAVLSLPGPDPRLAAETIPTIVRTIAIQYLGFLGVLFLAEALPSAIRLPVLLVVGAGGLVAVAWWYRRHPPSTSPVAPPAVSGGHVTADEVDVSAGEWLRAALPIAVIVAFVVALVLVVSRLAYPA
jgi:hypothetical protein